MTSLRKAFRAAVILSSLVLAGAEPLRAQVLRFAVLPLGWCNLLGPHSPAGTAMGETVFGAQGPQAGFLNPGVLGLARTEEFSLVFRLAQSTFRTRMYDYVSMTNNLMKWRKDRSRLRPHPHEFLPSGDAIQVLSGRPHGRNGVSAKALQESQSATARRGTLRNSRRLCVTSVAPRLKAWAPIWVSSGPTGVPAFSSAARTTP